MVDVLVTDYMMPGMDGGELARRVKLDYQIPVLLITGYTGTADDNSHLPRLAKPFGRAEIAAALAALFDDSKVLRFPGSQRKR
jgi:CheY-like chemotaxis protein